MTSTARLGVLLLVAGLIGGGAALELAIEKVRLLEDPLRVPACSLSETVDCGSILRSDQSQAFGFPNPFLGLLGFGAVSMVGLVLVTAGAPSRRAWLVVQAGLTFAVVFVHWLIFQTLYRLEALCPFCMAVWSVTIPAFWYVTLHNAAPYATRADALGRAVAWAQRNHLVVVTAWMLLIAGLALERFAV